MKDRRRQAHQDPQDREANIDAWNDRRRIDGPQMLPDVDRVPTAFSVRLAFFAIRWSLRHRGHLFYRYQAPRTRGRSAFADFAAVDPIRAGDRVYLNELGEAVTESYDRDDAFDVALRRDLMRRRAMHRPGSLGLELTEEMIDLNRHAHMAAMRQAQIGYDRARADIEHRLVAQLTGEDITIQDRPITPITEEPND